jgi:hypothetical protein
VTSSISDGNKIILSIKNINRLDNTNSTDVVTLGTISDISDFHLVDGIDGSSLKVEFNGVLDLNFRR